MEKRAGRLASGPPLSGGREGGRREERDGEDEGERGSE